jgi:hypothetical protein
VGGYGRTPLRFEANAGQTDSRVKFLARGPGYILFFTGDEAVLTLRKAEGRNQISEARRSKTEIRKPKFENRQSTIETATGIPRPLIPNLAASIHASERQTPDPESRASALLRLKLLGANPAAKATGQEELPGKANYFIGNDPKKWRSNVPTYAKVNYKDVYPGVDLVYYGNQSGQLEYDFVVAPGADPSAIALEAGAGPVPGGGRPQGSPLRIAADGDLVIPTEGGELRLHKPVVYQEQSTVGSPQSTAQGETRNSTFGARGSPLVTRHFLDGRFLLDAQNRVHFALGSYDRTKPLVIDPVLSYSTYLGGSVDDWGLGIAVDSSGNAYVTGETESTDFPTANPLQASLNGGANVFVSKLNATGSALVYSTYLGGSTRDVGSGIAVDSSGNAYVAGYTSSNNFPTANPLQASLGATGATNAFVAKLNPAGSALVYSTYLGGSNYDYGSGIAVDSSGNAYVTGFTSSTNFPTANPLQPSLGASDATNAFLAKLDATGSALVYSTYLGGNYWDRGTGIAVDSSGDAYIIGETASTNFPTANPLPAKLSNFYEWGTPFVAELNATGSALVYSTYLGGNDFDYGSGIAVDSSGNAYVTGQTKSTSFPTVNPLQARLNSDFGNAFVAKLNWNGSALSLVYSTYLGGNGEGGDGDMIMYCGTLYGDCGEGIAVDSSGNAYVTGYTSSTNFPTANPVQASLAGYLNAFVAELNSTGSALVYSTYLGGSAESFESFPAEGVGQGIAVDSSGNAHVIGYTDLTNFPTANPLQASLGGTSSVLEGGLGSSATNAFVAKIGAANSPGVALGPGALAFAPQNVGTSSPLQSVTLTAAGSEPLSLTSITASGDFALATTGTSCPYSGGTEASASTCTIDVTFTPTAAGTRTGMLTITDNNNGVTGSTQTATLIGIGLIAPTLVSLLPSSATVGGAAFTLTVSGTNFLSDSTVLWNRTGLTTLYLSSTQLTGTVPASDITAAGTVSVQVINPCPGGCLSNALTFTINNPVPTTTSLSPSSATAGGAAFTLTVTGTNFLSSSLVQWNGSARTTTWVSGTQLTAAISASDIATAGMASVTVLNPSPGGGTSNALTFTINKPLPVVMLSASSVTFGNQLLGTTSAAQTETVTNSGTGNLTIASVGLTGTNASDFGKSTDTCTGATVIPNGSCGVSVAFTPSASGSRTATLSINDNAANSPQSVSLSGTGIAARLSATTLSFGAQLVDSSSAPKTVTLRNLGSTPLTISGVTVVSISPLAPTGTEAGDFTILSSSTCVAGGSVAGLGSCTINLTFKPTAVGVWSATLVIADSDPSSPQTVSLSGMGTAVSLSATSLGFGAQPVGTQSVPKTIVLANLGSTPLSIANLTLGGTDAADFAIQSSSTCAAGDRLASGGSCTISLAFKPTRAGLRSATLSISDSDPSSPQSVALSGTGVRGFTPLP